MVINMLAQERRNQILERLQEEKSVVVADLSQYFKVSEETIRRDLDKLEKEGFAEKSYGGAVLNENVSIDLPFNIRKKHNITGKQKIAEIVETLIESGDHIILDASSTAVFIAKALKDKKNNMTVITNSLEIMFELSDVPNWQIISLGGNLRQGYLALFGSRVIESVSSYRVEKTIISCKGVDLSFGLSDGNEDFAQAKKAMLGCAKERILAVDHTKFGTVAFAKIHDMRKVDVVVTDKKPSDEWMEFFVRNHIRCMYP